MERSKACCFGRLDKVAYSRFLIEITIVRNVEYFICGIPDLIICEFNALSNTLS